VETRKKHRALFLMFCKKSRTISLSISSSSNTVNKQSSYLLEWTLVKKNKAKQMLLSLNSNRHFLWKNRRRRRPKLRVAMINNYLIFWDASQSILS
jgi:hypothetical protein